MLKNKKGGLLKAAKAVVVTFAITLGVMANGTTVEAKSFDGGKETIEISDPKFEVEVPQTPEQEDKIVADVPEVPAEEENPVISVEIPEEKGEEVIENPIIVEDKEETPIISVEIPEEEEEEPEIKVTIPDQKEEIEVPVVEPKPEPEPQPEPQPEPEPEPQPEPEPEPTIPAPVIEVEDKEEVEVKEPVVEAKSEKWGLEVLPALPNELPATGDSSDILLYLAGIIAGLFATINLLSAIRKSNDNNDSDVVVRNIIGEKACITFSAQKSVEVVARAYRTVCEETVLRLRKLWERENRFAVPTLCIPW